MKYKFSAFTILELILVMILSGLVISIGYLAYSIANQQLTSYRTTSKKIEDFSQFSKIIKSDFAKSERIIKKGGGFECQHLEETISYNIQYDFVARSSSLGSDTFSINIIRATFMADNEKKAFNADEITKVILDINWKEEAVSLIASKN